MSISQTPTDAPLRWKRLVLPAIAGLWILALVPGIRYLLAFERTPGGEAPPAVVWPVQLATNQNPHLPTLVVALHPRCSCSQATLTELDEAAKDFGHPFNAILLIDQPRGANYEWRQVSFYREAQQALHAKVILDDDGLFAARFGALTSGDVFLYSSEDSSAKRSLLFAGGVTASRGMIGPNKGIEALKLAFKTNSHVQHASSPVFGCALFATSASQDRITQ